MYDHVLRLYGYLGPCKGVWLSGVLCTGCTVVKSYVKMLYGYLGQCGQAILSSRSM